MNKKGNAHRRKSTRKIRQRSCAGKKRYRTESHAAADAHILQRHNPSVGWYFCKFCGYYHVGKRNKNRIRSAVARARNNAWNNE